MGKDNSPSLIGTIIRHIKDRDLDIETLWRGAKLTARHIATLNSEDASLRGPIVMENFLDHPGLSVASYKLSTPITRLIRDDVDVRFFHFPREFRLNVALDTLPSDTEKRMINDPEIIAAFHGPTFVASYETERVANNGFMFCGEALVPFGETDPPGLRRGAIALLNSGESMLVTDAEKWGIVNDPSVAVLSGTSDYLLSTDSVTSLQDDPRPRHCASFLIQNNTGRLSYCPIYSPVSRATILRLLQTYAADFGIGNFIAVELEHNGAACYIRQKDDSNTVYAYPGHVGYKRRDHYYFYI